MLRSSKINDKVVPYYLSPKQENKDDNKETNVITMYNGKRAIGDASKLLSNYYNVEQKKDQPNVGTLDEKYAGMTIQEMFDHSFEWILKSFRDVNNDKLDDDQRRKMLEDAESSLRDLDIFSTRGFLALLGDVGRQASSVNPGDLPPDPNLSKLLPRAFSEKLGMPPSAIQWLETTTTGQTGWYDEGFSQTLMELADFDSSAVKLSGWVPDSSPLKNKEWVCLDGGSQVIVDGMVKRLGLDASSVINKRVTSIKKNKPEHKLTVSYATDQGTETKDYDQVICTAALGCIASMELDGLLSYPQQVAVRSLQYDASCKIGVRFKSRWWQTPGFLPNGPIFGGVSKSDTPLSNVVYPSYGDGVDNAPGVLICSYTWAQDAKVSKSSETH